MGDRGASILDWTGRPIVDERGSRVESGPIDEVRAKSLIGAATGYLRSLRALDYSAAIRARDPLSNHAWVFAAAVAIAMNAAQATYSIYAESDDEQESRRRRAKSRGRSWSAGRRRKRRAIQRHLAVPLAKRMARKGLELDLDHPLYDVLLRPNPIHTAGQHWMLTYLWLAIRGEAWWVLTDEDGDPLFGEGTPGRMYVVSPDCFTEPILSHGDHGELEGWWMRVPPYLPWDAPKGSRAPMERHEVIQFKLPNPLDPLRGLSRLTAAAGGIETGLLVDAHNRSILVHDGAPKGVLTYPGAMEPSARRELEKKWREQFEGPKNAGRTAVLDGGLEYQTVGLTPSQMAYIDQKKISREEILAAMGVPPGVLGVLEQMTYSNQQAHQYAFWSKTVLPMLALVEQTLDGTLLFEEPDSVVGAYDLTGIDELRIGLTDKISQAKSLAGNELHVPPRTALELVGVDVASYEGDDVALVGAFATPVGIAIDAAEDLVEPETEPDAPADDTPPADEEAAATRASDPWSRIRGGPWTDLVGLAPRITMPDRARMAKAASRWRQFIKLQTPVENSMRRVYRGWVSNQEKAALERFDDIAAELERARRGRTKQGIQDFLAILPDLGDAAADLKSRNRPVYAGALEQTYEFTAADLGGLPTFQIDDESILRFFDLREQRFVGSATGTLIRGVRRTLEQGIAAGESVQQLRLRVSESFGLARSSARALATARTESAGFINGVRDEMFNLQGIGRTEWLTAGDENVRDAHVTFGDAGAQDRGFNWLTLVDGVEGRLLYPGDVEGPAGQVINCRCTAIPSE